jgi:hypothetical protein
MERPRVAVNAPVFATAIRIDACLEADVRAGVVGDDLFCSIPKKLGLAPRPIFFLKIDIFILFDVERLESICRTPRCAPSMDRLGNRDNFSNERAIFLLASLLPLRRPQHAISSHEHISMSSSFMTWIARSAHDVKSASSKNARVVDGSGLKTDS